MPVAVHLCCYPPPQSGRPILRRDFVRKDHCQLDPSLQPQAGTWQRRRHRQGTRAYWGARPGSPPEVLVKPGLADPLTLYVAHCGKWRETSTYQRSRQCYKRQLGKITSESLDMACHLCYSVITEPREIHGFSLRSPEGTCETGKREPDEGSHLASAS